METYIVTGFPVGWNHLRLEKFLSTMGGVLFTKAGHSIAKIPAGRVEGLRKKGFGLKKA